MDDILNFIRGIVRPVITFAFAGAIVYLAVKGTLDVKEIVTPTGMIIAFWFGESLCSNKRARWNTHHSRWATKNGSGCYG